MAQNHTSGGVSGWLAALLPAALTVLFASMIGRVASGDIPMLVVDWVPLLEVSLSFQADGLALLFALLVSGIGALVCIYAGTYLAGHRHLRRFYLFILLFMISMLGIVLAGNLITLYVFWELTSITSYLLIGFDHEKEESRRAALQALLVTGAGGLALLAGFIMMGLAAGSMDIATILSRGSTIRDHANYLPMLLLVLFGAFTKSAQFPFHFWLPEAMAAPTPVSAYLHSATMVKAGIYLLARFTPVLGGTDAWYGIVTTAGATTMVLGAWLALRQSDLKRILAYTTLSALGALAMLIGVGTGAAITAAMVFLVVHSLYKGALFLVTGGVDHATGTRDIGHLGGLRRSMPVTASAAVLAALSMAGLPPLLGFIGKELVYGATLDAPLSATLLTGTAVLANMLMVAAAGIVAIGPFFGDRVPTPHEPHEPATALWLGPIVLAVLGLGAGLFPSGFGTSLIAPATGAIMRSAVAADLGLWHGFNTMLLLSGITVALGAGTYLVRGHIRHLFARFRGIGRFGPGRWYRLALDGILAFARFQTRLLQNGHLGRYITMVLLLVVGLAGFTFFSRHGLSFQRTWSSPEFHEYVIAGVILAAAITTTLVRSRLLAIAALGVIGYGVALTYILIGAPDLAMTQFAIETLTVFLFVLVLYRLPRFARFSTRKARLRDAIIAICSGALFTILVLAVTEAPGASRLTPFFAENSLPGGKGRNIVNVILVDFRALDTLGEITVLSIAAIGVYALLKLRTTPGDDE